MFGSIKKRLISSLTVIALAVCDAVPVMPINAGYRSAFGHSAAAADAGDEAERQELSYQSIEVRPNEDDPERTVTLDGMMPEGASAEAVDLTEERGALAAYDITINGGEGEFQPEEDSPIRVEIADPFISGDADLELWHIRDDGEREQITDFTAEDGKITFMAAGFSIYEIVEAEELADVKPVNTAGFGWQKISDVSKLAEYGEGSKGLYISHTDGYYFKDTTYNPKAGRTGILKAKKSDGTSTTTDEAIALGAVPYYFEQADPGAADRYYVYYLDSSSNKHYIMNYPNNSLDFTTNDSKKTSFTFAQTTQNKVTGICAQSDTYTSYYWNQQADASGNGFCAFGLNKGGTFDFWYYVPIADDPYKLDGKTYGLMNHTSGTAGNGLAVDQSGSSLEMLSWIVRKAEGTSTYYVTEQDDITRWTFHSGKDFEDNYYISTAVGSKDMYLHIDETGISLSDEPQKIKVTPNNNTEIMLSVDGKTLTFDTNQFVVGTVNINDQNKLLSFVKLSSMTDDEEVTYSAKKIGASEI